MIQRKHSITVTIEGHTLQHVLAGLSEVQNELSRGMVGNKFHTTPPMAWYILHEMDEAMTPERYEAGLAALKRRVAETN